jgi:hypothetical protein
MVRTTTLTWFRRAASGPASVRRWPGPGLFARSFLETSEMSGAAAAAFNIFSVHVISLVVAFLALVAVFVYIPFVSDYAFWFMFAAYVGLAAHR